MTLLITRSMQALLYGVSAVDPLVYAGASATLAGAFAAVAVPAFRAMRVDPLTAIRSI